MIFADVLRKNADFTRTENGAVAIKTTGEACLDYFSTVGALRMADDVRIERLLAVRLR